jgi:hypothetical protein
MGPAMDRREFLLTPSGLLLANRLVAADPVQKPVELRYRQVHLDFHTSEQVDSIGAQFDPDEFARTLAKAHVNSVTCFARCHHGWIYFDTQAFPERRHPHLTRNLLKDQIDACHKQNIRVPIYVTIQWDHFSAQRHPEWLVMNDKGAPTGTPVYEPGFYRHLCVNTPYRAFLTAHVTEICNTLPVDGFFFDIVQPVECSCYNCRTDMKSRGMDPTNAQQRQAYALTLVNNWQREMSALVRRYDRNATIFYNAGHIGPKHRQIADAYSHWELESLPSGGWGYLDFPLKVRYTRTLGLDSLGMTGKFHTSWGDFHSLKNSAALQYECFQMLALGAKCSVGDQLHPTGKIDQPTYDLIGAVYAEVEQKEPWCRGAEPVAEIGVLTPEEFIGGAAQKLPDSAFGAVRMLTECGFQFDVLDSKSDFARYKLLILPDQIPVNAALAEKIDGYAAKGGSVIASWESGLGPLREGFALDCLGVKYIGDAPFSPDFLVMDGPLAEGLPKTELVMYKKGKQVEPLAGTRVLLQANVPYFNRTYDHFFSHAHTPSSGQAGYPAVLRSSGRCIYFIHPVFSQYQANAPLWVKRVVANAVRQLIPMPLVVLNAPSSTLAALNAQPEQSRWVLHLLHFIPERRGAAFDVIEDMIPLADVGVKVHAARPVKEVIAVPQNQRLPFRQEGHYTAFVLPKLTGHQMIAIEFA